MTQVSRRFMKEEVKLKIDQLFYESLLSCNSKKSTQEFIEDLLTSTEKVMLAKRLTIAYLLLKGYPYEIINKTLKVSYPTIRIVALTLKYKGNGLRNVLKEVIKRRNWHKLFEEIGEAAIDILGSGKGGNWKATKSFLYQRKAERQSLL